MTQYITRQSASARVGLFLRSSIFLGRMAAIGLVAIGVSGVCCSGVRYRYGDHTLAFDQETAYLSELRCAGLLDAEKMMCESSRLAHHADEIVEVRLSAGVVGLLAFAAYLFTRSRFGLSDDESRLQRRRFLWLATVSFGFAAATLLTSGVSETPVTGDAAGHASVDGSVSLAFFLVSAGMLVAHEVRRRGSAVR